MTRKKRIDFAELRQIPILTVAEALGIDLRREGSGVWAMKDPGDPREVTSLRIFESSNRWKRFSGVAEGGVSEGSVIDLVIHIRNCELKEAAEFLTPYL